MKPTKDKIPGYRILEVRGVGAMATVYRAEQMSLARQVALKILHDKVAEDADYRERFLREARAAARMNHPNVVRAYEAGVHEGAYYFAMEFVEGEDLSERLARTGPLPEAEALALGIEVARALLAAQEHGMVHRDVKPENILLASDGGVKLADLGLAKVQGDASITQPGYSLGTVAFFSPEQCHGAKDLDIRSDLFALGGTLWTALTGELPFGRGENPPATMKQIIEEHPPGLEEPSRVTNPTRDALLQLMAKDRRDRPADARAAIALLEATLERVEGGLPPGVDSSESGGPGRRAKRRRRRRGPSLPGTSALPGGSGVTILILAIVVLGLGILIGALPALGRSSAPLPGPRSLDDGGQRPRARDVAVPAAQPRPAEAPR